MHAQGEKYIGLFYSGYYYVPVLVKSFAKTLSVFKGESLEREGSICPTMFIIRMLYTLFDCSHYYKHHLRLMRKLIHSLNPLDFRVTRSQYRRRNDNAMCIKKPLLLVKKKTVAYSL